MSKTKSWIMDMEEQYYDIAAEKITECESFGEFAHAMEEHSDLITPLYGEYGEVDDLLSELWCEQQSKFL